RKRQQQQRLALGIAGNDDKGARAFAAADQSLPGAEQVEALVGREEVSALLEGAPDRLGLAGVADDIDTRDTARFRPRGRFCRPAVTLPETWRFVALTVDGANKDLIDFAYPVLARHDVPFTVYVPTAFPDGVGEAWWLGLERMIARESRVSLMMGEKEQRFTV